MSSTLSDMGAWASIKAALASRKILGSHLDPEGRGWLYGANRYTVSIDAEGIDVAVSSRNGDVAALREVPLADGSLDQAGVDHVVAEILAAEQATADQRAEAVGGVG